MSDDIKKDPIEPIKPVENSTAKIRKKTRSTIMLDSMVSASTYVVQDVIIPRTIDALSDSLHGWIDHIFDQFALGGRPAPRTRGRNHRTSTAPSKKGTFVNYNGMTVNQPAKESTTGSRRISKMARENHDFSEIIVATRQEANEHIDSLYEHLNQYGSVTVDEFYSLVGVDSEFTDVDWGWTDLRGTAPRRVGFGSGSGFVIDLPAPEYLA